MTLRSRANAGLVLGLLAALVVVRVAASVVANYPGYAPPDFRTDFLHGREGYFWDGYHRAFYAHIASGPVALLLGLFLVAERSRGWFPTWHRRLGWLQVACVVLVVAPSGLGMARYAAAGPIAAASLATLAVATAACTLMGAWTAKRRRYAAHRRWMWRSFLLLASAVVLRLFGGLAVVAGATAPWIDPAASWASWLLPLAAFEVVERMSTRVAMSK